MLISGFYLGRMLTALLLACGVLTTRAAEVSDPGKSLGMVAVPAGFSKAEVQDAITAVLAIREWSLTAKTDGRVVGYVKRRTNEATLTVIYNETQIEFFCTGWQIDKKTGAREKPEVPTSWVGTIKADLTKMLTRRAGKR